MDSLRVEFKKVHPDAVLPEYHTSGAAAFDLAPIEHINLFLSDGPRLFRTGLVIGAPEGHFLFITHRSSTPKRHGITVLNGIVDRDYSGNEDELHLSIRVVPPQQFTTVLAGTRIAQGLFLPVTRGRFAEVESMGESRGGFGSTG